MSASAEMASPTMNETGAPRATSGVNTRWVVRWPGAVVGAGPIVPAVGGVDVTGGEVGGVDVTGGEVGGVTVTGGGVAGGGVGAGAAADVMVSGAPST